MHAKIVNVFIRMSLGFATCSALLANSGACRAETTQIAKGITGGALLGGEVVMLTEAALGVKPVWAYIVGGVAGAGAGGVGGYYLAESTDNNKPTSFLVAGGVALVIPTLIGIAMATHFEPPEEHTQEQIPNEEPPYDAEPPPPAAKLGLPTLNVAQAFTPEELAKYGVRQTTELHVSLLNGVF